MSLKTDTLLITPEFLTFIVEIDEFKGAWHALGTFAPERLLVLHRVATIDSISSSIGILNVRKQGVVKTHVLILPVTLHHQTTVSASSTSE